MKLSFESKLERIATESEYYALSVPAKITKSLGTTQAVPILARINGCSAFRGSLIPVGGGRHYMRVKASVRDEAGIKGGDRVKVQITVADRKAEADAIPKDLEKALRSEGVLADFKAITPGKRSYMLRLIDAAVKPETRARKVQAAVEAAHQEREKRVDS